MSRTPRIRWQAAKILADTGASSGALETFRRCSHSRERFAQSSTRLQR